MTDTDTNWLFRLSMEARTVGACPLCGFFLVVTTAEDGAIVRECSGWPAGACEYVEPCPADIISRLRGDARLPGL